jgi:hypothetical protein
MFRHFRIWHEPDQLNPANECPLFGVDRKTCAHAEFF